MDKSLRRPVIAGNWKMNKTPAETKAIIEEMKPLVANADCDVVICAPYIDLYAAMEAAEGSNIKIGAENVHFEEKGAYTGEISAAMLKECGIEYVIVGHSERRQYFGETDTTVNLRTKAAINAGMKVLLCLGEVKDERLNGITDEIVSMQTKLALKDITKEQLSQIIIAYEPVWAIGTGLTATPEQADETCGVIRNTIKALYGEEAAEEIIIQYGGSMNAANAAELLAKENVDGGLIGGASLKAKDFSIIVDAAQ
jgi:triosephosphate isomerase